MQSHRMHDAIPTLQKIHALRESCAKCYFCQGGLKLLLTTVEEKVELMKDNHAKIFEQEGRMFPLEIRMFVYE